MGIKVSPLPKKKKKKKQSPKVKRPLPGVFPDLPTKKMLGLTDEEYKRFMKRSGKEEEEEFKDSPMPWGRGSEKLWKKRLADKKKKEAIKKANELNKGELEPDDKSMGITKRKTLPSRGEGWLADVAELEVASGGTIKKNYAHGGSVRKAKFTDS